MCGNQCGFVLIGTWLLSACGQVTTVDLLPENARVGAAGVGTAGKSSIERGGNAGAAGSARAPTSPRPVHRYDFEGTGTTVVDSVGAQDGVVMGGASLDGSGQLSLLGDQQQYVKLPSGLISSLTSLTIVSFITWHGGNPWQSVFNFGATDTGAPSEKVISQFFFTPLMQPGPGTSLHLNVAYGVRSQDSIDGTEPFPIDTETVVVATFDGEHQRFSLYIDRVLVLQSKSTDQRLADLNDTNCWLGQSQWAHDVTMSGNFSGSFNEFRIYDGVMSDQQIRNLTDPNLL
jgi:hypothetical protein